MGKVVKKNLISNFQMGSQLNDCYVRFQTSFFCHCGNTSQSSFLVCFLGGLDLESWTPYYAFKMCPIFCSFPNFGLIRKIPLLHRAQLVSFGEEVDGGVAKNVDPPLD